jgi:hypothetical protein
VRVEIYCIIINIILLSFSSITRHLHIHFFNTNDLIIHFLRSTSTKVPIYNHTHHSFRFVTFILSHVMPIYPIQDIINDTDYPFLFSTLILNTKWGRYMFSSCCDNTAMIITIGRLTTSTLLDTQVDANYCKCSRD